MPSKVTFFYHDNLGGFTESWIDNANQPTTPYPVGLISDYLSQRMKISGQQTTWDYVRITDVDPARARQVRIFLPTDPALVAANVPLNGQYRTGARVAAAENSDFAGTRFLVRKESSDLFSARVFLAGFPDNQVDNGGLYVPSGQFPAAFDAWINTCNANAYGWFTYTTPLAGSQAQLTTAVTQTDSTCILTATPFIGNPALFNAPIVIGQHVVVRISNQNSPRNLNGTFTVVVTGQNSCRTVKGLSVVNFIAGNGTISVKKTRGFKKISTAQIERVVKRGPGRPFGLYRGRQSVRPRG